MSVVGIIAEYNPFHNAHSRHIAEARRLCGADTVVALISASFTQRGEPAVFDKFTRARHALLGGADLVFELPDLLSCACAERFALGGVRILSAAGIVNTLAFGSECGDASLLRAASENAPDPSALRRALESGLSYPSALAKASAAALGPNDILAVEYLKSLSRIAPEIAPMAIKRFGAAHDGAELCGCFASASALRGCIEKKALGVLARFVPQYVHNDIADALEKGTLPADLNALSKPVLYALRSLGAEGIAALADVSEGLENPIGRAALTSSSVDELLHAVKTKRYTLARLRRILSYALLGTTGELQAAAADGEGSLYIRVLGVKKGRETLLSELAKKAQLPVVIGIDDAKKLNKTASRVLEHSRRAALIRALASPIAAGCRDDFSHPLVVAGEGT